MAPELRPLLTMSQNSSSSQIITTDTPSLPPALISDAAWDLQPSPYSASSMETTDWGYYTMPLSPPTSLSSHMSESPEPPTKKPRLSVSLDSHESEQQQCIPTQKVFDLPEALVTPSASTTQSSSGDNPLLAKKFFTASHASAKRTRGSGERISTKDFVPPDVSGLSKREARLVKNRAAAFLSRQRKREEFEAMEVRVKQLEEENARLQHLVEKVDQHEELCSEIERLRVRLQAAEKRELNLTMEIARRSTPVVKAEATSDCLSPAVQPPEQPISSVAFGLTRHILVRALPSLLSMSPESPLPTTVSIPLSELRGEQSPSPFEPLSTNINGSVKTFSSFSSSNCPVVDAQTLHNLDNVIISFDTLAEEGSIRMRIQPQRLVSKVHSNALLHHKSGDKPRSSSLGTWAGSAVGPYGQPYTMQPLTSPPPSLPMDTPSPATTINQFCAFLGSGSPRTCPDYQTLMMPYMQQSFGSVGDQPPFDLFSNSLDHATEEKAKYQGRAFPSHLGGESSWQVPVC
ncbi:hypothetical protein ID866_3597 [Astraeus odoratus]|nr:hypothetical protein ID866_3597 [Astraeus odoratus]